MIQAIVWAFVLTSGAGMSLLGADDDADLGRVAAGQALELLVRELLGVDDDAALAAAVRDADDGALPGHPHRQGLDLVEGDVLVVADAALGRAAAQVVLDAVAGEDLDAAVVHLHREVDRQLAARFAQDPPQARIEVQAIGGQVELLLGDGPRIDRRAAVCSVVMERRSSVPADARTRASGVLSLLPEDPTVRGVGRRLGEPAARCHLRPSIATRFRAGHRPDRPSGPAIGPMPARVGRPLTGRQRA